MECCKRQPKAPPQHTNGGQGVEKIGGGGLGSLGLVIADERHESLESALLRKLNCVLLCGVAVEFHCLL
jgi:hypothetical protein